MAEEEQVNPIRKTTAAARQQARSLIRSARFGAFAVLDPHSGAPFVSRVATATDLDGAPLILVSTLALHTGAIAADPRCALLLGEPGAGDPLAHPRITINCRARRLQRGEADRDRAERRYLSRHPKARLYAGFADFSFVRLTPESAALNGGFGKAFELTAHDIVTDSPANSGLEDLEASALEHMNADHRDAIGLCARHFGKAKSGKWAMTGIDADGFDLASGDRVLRIFFPKPLGSSDDLRRVLAEMTATARAAL